MSIQKLPVSVVIPCYCCSETIQRAVCSVVNQTMLPSEIFLIEDASPDNNLTLNKLYEIQNKFGELVEIKVITLQKNSGPSLARNTGWDSSSQTYIAFLDADDSWHNRKLEIQYGYMSSHPDIALTGHLSVVRKEEIFDSQLPSKLNFKKVNLYRLLFSNCLLTPSVMLLRNIKCRFNTKSQYSEDYDLWLNIAFGGGIIEFLDVQLSYLYKAKFGESGLSANMWEMEFGELKMYYRLYISGIIPIFLLLITTVFSIIKYIRRLLILRLQGTGQLIRKKLQPRLNKVFSRS